MAKRGRPRKNPPVEAVESPVKDDLLKSLEGIASDVPVAPVVTEDDLRPAQDHGWGSLAMPDFTYNKRQAFMEAVAIQLVVEMCKARGNSLDDHADNAVHTARKLANLLEIE